MKILFNNLLVAIDRVRMKWLRIGGAALLAILGIILFFRGCSSTMHNTYLYHIARDTNQFPFDSEKGKSMLAFSNELLTSITEEEQIRIRLTVADASTLLQGLDNEEYEAVMAPITPNATNKDRYEFSDPIYLLGPVLIVKKGSSIRSLEQLEGKMIGLTIASASSFNVYRYPSLIIRTFENAQQALSNLESNQIDAVILDFLTAYTYVTGIFSGKVIVASPPLTNEGLHIIAKKNARGREFIHYFNEGFKAIKKSGHYNDLIKKWGLYPQPQ